MGQAGILHKRAWWQGLGRLAGDVVGEIGALALFFARILKTLHRRPYRFGLVIEQAYFVGVESAFIVVLTGVFTGAVFTLQSAQALELVGLENMVGATVLLAVARELGPVLTGLMVAGRVGSAMATELGTMRVTEQIDALEVMAVDPVHYLAMPRLLASAVMMPVLCVVFACVATLGSWAMAAVYLQVDPGAFWGRIRWTVDPNDFGHGLCKAFVFGIIIALAGCYKGYHAQGGARGVGRATTQAVVMASIAIFVLDYVLTAILLPLSAA